MKRPFRHLVWLVIGIQVCLLAEEVDVYLLGGQSNMQGIAPIAELPPDFPRAFDRIFFWNGTEFERLAPGQTPTSQRPGEFGPELGLALEMQHSGRPIYLIKTYASGMPLDHGWNANRWEGGDPVPGRRNFYPGETDADPNVGTLYGDMLDRFRAGLRGLREAGKTPVPKGFVWMQGEQDSKHPESAGNYAASLLRLRRRLAEDVGAEPGLPLVFGQVLPHEPAMERFTHRDVIRAQMAAADERSGLPEAIPHARMVSTDGMGLLPDTVHYDAAGQLQLGRALARALREIEGAP